MSKPCNYYDSGDMARSMDKLVNDELQPGQKFRPLLLIPIDNMVIDKLHLLLRVTDVLE